MTPEEVEKLIGDLEVAVDRLRSLYEQYFMGFEKLEPTVPRKDVDRKIHVLRKEQIRNTAQRFRFQMVLQRYNTYQTHWQRICREIDSGTYKRHVLRAEQRFGSEAQARTRSQVGPQPGAPVTDPEIARALAELDLDFAPPSGRQPPRPSARPAGRAAPTRKPTPAPFAAVRPPAPAAPKNAPPVPVTGSVLGAPASPPRPQPPAPPPVPRPAAIPPAAQPQIPRPGGPPPPPPLRRR